MARLRFGLNFLGIAAVLQFAHGQMMIVPPPMMLRPPNHPHHMPHLIQPVQITERPEYPNPKEAINVERLQQRIKELETSKQALRQKQIELDDKIAILHEEAVRCEKQIGDDQQEIHKLEELERLHYMEQVRLEQLIEQQRMAEYQEKLNQERLAQQREIDEMHRKEEERQRNAVRKDTHANGENSANGTYEARIEEDTSDTYEHRLDERPSNEHGRDTIQTRGFSERVHKNEQPHSTGHLRPEPSEVEETLADLRPKIAPRVKHVIEKKEVRDEPTEEVISGSNKFKLVNGTKTVPLVKISGPNNRTKGTSIDL